MKYSEPKLFDLKPESVLRFYKVINDFTDFDKLKSVEELRLTLNSKKLTVEEKYFIVYYLPKYFDYKNSNSIIRTKLKEIEDIGDMEENIDSYNKINEFVSSINDECKIKQKLYKREYNVFKNLNLDIQKINKSLNEEIKDWSKLPIEKSFKNELIEYFINQLTEYYSEETIMKIIDNSFQINTLTQKPKFLNLEYSSSVEIYKAFKNIYIKYCEFSENLKDASSQNENKISKSYNLNKYTKEEIKKAEDRLKYINRKNKSEYYKASNRKNFAKIMFLTFTKVRENYIKNKDNRSLELHLTNIGKNIK